MVEIVIENDTFVKIGESKLFCTEDNNREITVKDMYDSIQPNQFIFAMFFNRWG